MNDFEQLQQVVGTERIIKLFQEVAKEAIDAGDWVKVRQITELVERITGHADSSSGEQKLDAGSSEMPLTALNISNRCLELLKKAGIHTVTDISRYSLESLLEINGLGEFAAQQIDSALQEKGIMLESVKLRWKWQEENSVVDADLSDIEADDRLSDADLDESLHDPNEGDASLADSYLDETNGGEGSSDNTTF